MNVISAFSFGVEPGDLWTRRITRKFRHLAPQIEEQGVEAHFRCPSEPTISIEVNEVPWAGSPLSTMDAARRCEEAAKRGIGYELVFPTFSWSLYSIRDLELQAACLKAYNIFAGCMVVNTMFRLGAAAMLPSGAAGVTELDRCVREAWHKAVVIPAASSEDLPLALLRRATEAGMFVVLAPLSCPSPALDFAGFSSRSHALAKSVLARSPGPHQLMVPLHDGSMPDEPDEQIHYVLPRSPAVPSPNLLWGELGTGTSPETANMRDPAFHQTRAHELLSLPEPGDTGHDAYFARLREYIDRLPDPPKSQM